MADMARQESNEESPRDVAKRLILEQLGVRRVAAWCGVTDMAVYQWFTRSTNEAPVPARHVQAIVRGAKAEGLDAPLVILMPDVAAVQS